MVAEGQLSSERVVRDAGDEPGVRLQVYLGNAPTRPRVQRWAGSGADPLLSLQDGLSGQDRCLGCYLILTLSEGGHGVPISHFTDGESQLETAGPTPTGTTLCQTV